MSDEYELVGGGSDDFAFTERPIVLGRSEIRFTERVVVCGEAPADFARFVLSVTVPVARRGDQVIQSTKSGAIRAETLEEAVSMAESTARELAAQARREGRSQLMKPQLAVPGGPVLPDGRK